MIDETEVKLMDADALPILVTKDFPHELLIGSDAIQWLIQNLKKEGADFFGILTNLGDFLKYLPKISGGGSPPEPLLWIRHCDQPGEWED